MTQNKKKENLILVHSFPTNSILLDGLVDYLNEHFNLHFVDLPGFTSETPYDAEEITLEHFSEYLDKEIQKTGWDEYILGGISFGFIVANNANFKNNQCKGIIAVEPYLQKNYLHMGFVRRFLYSHLIDVVTNFELTETIWNNKHLDDILAYLSGQKKDRMNTILEEIDGSVFFETAKLIMEKSTEPEFKDIPYVLVVNKDDATVDTPGIINAFEENVDPLLTIETDMDHYPDEITKEYFANHLPKEMIDKIINWINNQ